MSNDDRDDVKLSLRATLNKEGNKVLFAVADSHFADILLSFLTLPLGRIVKVFEKHYGKEAPTFGSLKSLYHGIANLDTSHFWTEGAKQNLLNVRSPFEAEHERLKIDISDSPPPVYLCCSEEPSHYKVRSVSICCDILYNCFLKSCGCKLSTSKEVVEKSSKAASSGGVFTNVAASFIVSDDLHIVPTDTGLLGIIGILGITYADIGRSVQVELEFSEIVSLLKASLTSLNPLTDVILSKTTWMNNLIPKYSQPKESPTYKAREFTLKVMIQNSTGKLLYAQAKKDFVEFLFSLLYIPLGEVERLLGGKTCFKAINNLHRSTAEHIANEYFSTHSVGSFSTRPMKDRLMKPNVIHGCICAIEDHILNLAEEPLPFMYDIDSQYRTSFNVRVQRGSYLQGMQTYKVTDDLTVVPYCFVSILSSLEEQQVELSDIKEVELKIGFKEALSILKASLTSTSALTHALFNHKQPKRED